MFRLWFLSALLTAKLVPAAPRPQPGHTPLVFEPNHGQASKDVGWLAKGPGFQLGITSSDATFVLTDAPIEAPAQAAKTSVPSAFQFPPPPRFKKGAKPNVVKMRLFGGGTWKTEGVRPSGGISNYFIGNKPELWRTNIPQYAQLQATGVYSGVDLVFHGEDGVLEYDLVVAPGADPRQVQLEFEGAVPKLDPSSGDLVLTTPNGKELRHAQPKVYQHIGHKKVSVKIGYEILSNGKTGFKLGEYDRAYPLVIDPTVTFTTFLAGSGDEEGAAVAVDGVGNSYVTGYTYSNNFPVNGGIQGNTDDVDGFVTKLSPTGTVLFSTYLGGGDQDFPAGIAVDPSGVYVTGGTQSSDFPSKQSAQPFKNGDAFVAKLSLLGNALVYSSFVGGSSTEWGYAIAVDASQSAYIGGMTHSKDFPVRAGFEYFPGGPDFAPIKGFVAKFSPNGASLVYSTYLGGAQGMAYDYVSSIAVDKSLSAYVTGETCSSDFPYAGYQSLPYPGTCSGFVTKFSPAGDSVIYSTYLVNNIQNSTGLAIDAAGNAYVTGKVTSGSFPTAVLEVFVGKVLPTGALGYFRFFHGNEGSSWGQGIAADAAGNAYVVGATTSSSFPGAPHLTPHPYAGFLMKLDPSGNGPVYSVLLGAQINAVAVVKPQSRIALPSYALIYTTGYRFTGGSNRDAFVVKLDETPVVVNQ